MEYTIVVNQQALRRWIARGQIDAADAMLVAFIRGLHPDDANVKRLMYGDYYRITRSWILREMPILTFTQDRLSRRLHELQKVGLVDLMRRRNDEKQWELYGRLSPLYYREEQKARDELEWVKTPMGVNAHGPVDNPRAETPTGENTHGCSAPTPLVKTPTDHKRDDHKRDAAPFSGGSGAPQDQEPSAAEPHLPSPENPFPDILARQKEASA